MGKNLTQIEFIEKALKKHNNKYTYEKTEYSGCDIKICITCENHGYFYQKPKDHLYGHGCSKCALEKSSKLYISNTEEFIKKSNVKHNNFYDYSKVKYINSWSKVLIICPTHGEFLITPSQHLLGTGCSYCSGHKFNTEIFINKANKKHNFKYSYLKTIYESYTKNVTIECSTHGEFEQMPATHLTGGGCPYCSKNKTNTELFIEKATISHGDKYDYSKTEYISKYVKVLITCPIHGEFKQTAKDHINGSGCPKCKESKLETEIRVLLENNNIKYVYEEHFKWLGRQTLDFYLPEYNIAIECQGAQHFKPLEVFGGVVAYKKVILMDTKKFNICKENNVKLFYFSNESPEEYLDKIYLDKQELLDEILKYPKITNDDTTV